MEHDEINQQEIKFNQTRIRMDEEICIYLEMALDMAYAKPFNVHQLKNELWSCTYIHTTQASMK